MYWIEPPSVDVNTNTFEVEITEGSVTPVQYAVHPGQLDSEAFDAYVNGLADDADMTRLRAYFEKENDK